MVARWQPSPGNRSTVAAALEHLAADSRAEAGCLGYEAYDGLDGETILVERYADHAALDAHRASDPFRRLAVERIVPLLAHREVVVATVE
ncbi:putative quinol monooxygenase [Streptomyces sp. NRRL F-2580]|uniref:putative quinol monooxygenase n=1 Tax=Streptomyces sp. NRRL F-2580 TaxID=1463841 RepID=UPI0004CC509D|nr:putative quinol monooxygenase [Streptomyces sp. NRRL F-2580]